MTANLILKCRSLPAGESALPPELAVPIRLQAGACLSVRLFSLAAISVN
jgi:hypothetical protein